MQPWIFTFRRIERLGIQGHGATLNKGYDAEHDGDDREVSIKPIFLIGEAALDKLTEVEELNDELWDRYKAIKKMVKETIKETVKEIIEDSPEFKKRNGKD